MAEIVNSRNSKSNLQLNKTFEGIRIITKICEDFNSKIGTTELVIMLEMFLENMGLASTIKEVNNLIILNIMFCYYIRRLYTWTSAGGPARNQIDLPWLIPDGGSPSKHHNLPSSENSSQTKSYISSTPPLTLIIN